MPALLQTINAVFQPKLNSHLAARLGESINGVRCGLQAGMAVVLNGLVAKYVIGENKSEYAFVELAQQGQATVTQLLIVVGSKHVAGSLMGQGEALLTLLFRSNEQELISSMSDYAGIKLESARTLLELLAGVLPVVINQFAERQKLPAEAASAALQRVAQQVRSQMPREFAGKSEAMGLHKANSVSWKHIQALMQDVTVLLNNLLSHWHIVGMSGRLAVRVLGLSMTILLSTLGKSAAPVSNSGDMTQKVETVTTMSYKNISGPLTEN